MFVFFLSQIILSHVFFLIALIPPTFNIMQGAILRQKLILLFSVYDPWPPHPLLLCIFSPGKWEREREASCTEACPACFGWRDSRSQVGCLLCGLLLCCSSAPSGIGEEGARDRGLVWTCLSESRGEDGEQRVGVWQSVTAWGYVCHVSICCMRSHAVRFTSLSKPVNHRWDLDINKSPVM